MHKDHREHATCRQLAGAARSDHSTTDVNFVKSNAPKTQVVVDLEGQTSLEWLVVALFHLARTMGLQYNVLDIWMLEGRVEINR